MNDLIKTELFVLMNESSQEIINFEMQHAYENFVKAVLTLNQSETDYQNTFRTLNLTRIELQSSQTQILYEQGKKCPKISLSSKGFSPCQF